ncbi:MAG TPA: Ig-like domain repeat protein [Fimbriimonas sp.]
MDAVYPSISSDGRYVAFSSSTALVPSDANGIPDVYRKDLDTGTLSLVSASAGGIPGNNYSIYPSISADGRLVAFGSASSNLVPGDSNGWWDVFVKDVSTGQIQLATTSSSGTQGVGDYSYISADGRFVVFTSESETLVPGDNNGAADIFVKELATGHLRLASAASDGTIGNGESLYARISADGRYIAFGSTSSNLVAGDANGLSDVFVKDMVTGAIRLASVASDGTQGNGSAGLPAAPSIDGRVVAFLTDSSNLTPDGSNSFFHTLVKDLATGAVIRASASSEGTMANSGAGLAGLSQDGSLVAYQSAATNLVAGDTNGKMDVFVHNTGFGSPPPTVMTLPAPALSVAKASVLSARLRDRASLAPLEGATVKFFFDGAFVGSDSTDADGRALLSWTVPEGTNVGTHRLQARFPGDSSHKASSAGRDVAVQKGPVRMGAANVSASPGATATLRARLLNASGQPLAGRTIAFKVAGVAVGSGVTNSLGIATRKAASPSTPGSYQISAEFAGDEGHTERTVTSTLTVG